MHQPARAFIVIGGQFGSEGKGEVVAALTSYLAKNCMGDHTRDLKVVRVGGPQAGHNVTLYSGGTKTKYPMCVIPCGFHETRAKLHIGPGSELNLTKLQEEIDFLLEHGHDVQGRISIDPRVTIMDPDHDKANEKVSELVDRIGSTGKGIGSCRSRRLMRTATVLEQVIIDQGSGTELPDHIRRMVTLPIRRGNSVTPIYKSPYSPNGYYIIESAQGFGLSLVASGFYPYCTSTDITPARIMADAGMGSKFPHRTVGVIRTFPIRVAGNSGPMFKETDWKTVHEISRGVSPVQGEVTTVTKKTRRIGEFDWDLLRAFANECQPDALVVTFMDYLFPELADRVVWSGITGNVRAAAFLDRVQETANCPVIGVSTGEGRLVFSQTLLRGMITG